MVGSYKIRYRIGGPGLITFQKMNVTIFVCALAGIILAIIGLVCWWGRCLRYITDQLRNIINESSEVEISSSDRSNPPESPIPAIIKYSKRKTRDQPDYK
jgi:hypothetical protein